jgi:hemolysin III
MVATLSKQDRFTRGEDLANALSHLAGAFLAIAGLVLMVVFSSKRGNVWHIVSSSIFGASMIFLYIISTITHWLPAGTPAKERFFIYDRSAIFILIAGTYTPLALNVLRGPLGWVIFGIEWGLAITGIVRLLLKDNSYEEGVSIFDILIYVIMGWLIVFVSGPVLRSAPFMCYMWIVIGGLFYTLGIIFFKVVKFRYHHLLWHLMVIGGSLSHFTAIFFYVIL